MWHDKRSCCDERRWSEVRKKISGKLKMVEVYSHDWMNMTEIVGACPKLLQRQTLTINQRPKLWQQQTLIIEHDQKILIFNVFVVMVWSNPTLMLIIAMKMVKIIYYFGHAQSVRFVIKFWSCSIGKFCCCHTFSVIF